MDNYSIADNFSLLSKIMDIHGENSFKTKSYSVASFTIEKLPSQLATIPQENIFSIKGIGDAIGRKIIEQLDTGRLKLLDEYLSKTPAGVIEMLAIKGIGPKKISVIWKELEIEDLGELLYACNENRLLLYKGFGEKTQQNIKESIEFFLSNKGSYLFSQIEKFANEINEKIKIIFPDKLFFITGDFNRQLETIDKLEWVTNVSQKELQNYFLINEYEFTSTENNESHFKGKENILFIFYHAKIEKIYEKLFEKNCSEEFLIEWKNKFPFAENTFYTSEIEIFSRNKINFIPTLLREKKEIILKSQQNNLPVIIQPNDIVSIIHSHSKWSDGVNTIEEMARHAIQKGLQYLVISDHSKSAFYANGLSVERITAQHKEVDELNEKLKPFKIFKSIESDILNDGSLDYIDTVLDSFDLVIASVHSNLKMKEEKAMMRLMNAIENKYTSILGHMTGRLLLSRNGYPVDHKAIIDACAVNKVAIELNAHPKRLDIDWRWIDYCIEKNVLISINPDAHALEGFDDIRYGVLVAQKAGLTKKNNLSSFSLQQFEQFIETQKMKGR